MQGFIQCLVQEGGAQTVAGDSLNQPATARLEEAQEVTCQKFRYAVPPAVGCRGGVERKGSG